MKMTVGKDDTSFHLLFQALPVDDKLIEEYNCSFNDGPSVSIGKLYISQNHVSYAPKIGSTQIIIPIREISSISKKNTVYLFPNAIEIVTLKEQRYFFTAFLSRDLAFSTLTTIIGAGGGTRTKIFEDAMSLENGGEKPIKSSSDEIPDNNNINEEKDPFQETPTYSTFQPRSQNNIVEKIEPIQDKEKLLNRQTPSPSSQMFKSSPNTQQNNDTNAQLIDSNSDNNSDSGRERKLSDSIVDNYPDNSNLSSSSSDQVTDENVNEKDLAEISTEKKEISNFSSINPTTMNNNNNSNIKDQIQKPLPLKDSSNNIGQVNNTTNTTNTPSSPLKSSQTINSPPTTSPPQKHQTLPKQQSFTKLGSLNISSEQSIINNNSTNNLNSSQQLPPPQQPLASSSTPPESPSTSRLPKFTTFESLPQGGTCDHIIYSDFDEGPWSTEKYNISMQEFYDLVIRSDFWGSANTTHGYTEQQISEWKQSGNCCIQRMMDFRAAIAFKIGPKSTRVTQTQRCRLKNKNEFVMETSSISKDVPYGDSFSVENLLSVQAVDENSCITRLSSKIKFYKTVWGISTMIQKSAYQGNKEFFILWNTMVRNQVETFAFNKSKAKRAPPPTGPGLSKQSSITIGSNKDIQQIQSLPQQPQSQTQESVLPTIINKELNSRPSTPSSLSSSTSTLKENNQSSFNISPDQSILSVIWSKMSATEKKYLFIVIILLLSSILGLMFVVVSSSSSSRSLNQQIYRFTDTLVLLDSKVTQLSNGGTNSPADASVTYHTDIGKDRLKYLQDRLDLAGSLLQRTHSIISSLQGELALETLKSERADQLYNDSGVLSISTIFITFLTLIGTFLWYSGYYTTIRELLPF